MTPPANDNTPIPILVPIIGTVGDDGRVTITDPTWPRSAEVVPFPSDPREA